MASPNLPIASLFDWRSVESAVSIVDSDAASVGEHLVAVDNTVLLSLVSAGGGARFPVSGEPFGSAVDGLAALLELWLRSVVLLAESVLDTSLGLSINAVQIAGLNSLSAGHRAWSPRVEFVHEVDFLVEWNRELVLDGGVTASLSEEKSNGEVLAEWSLGG